MVVVQRSVGTGGGGGGVARIIRDRVGVRAPMISRDWGGLQGSVGKRGGGAARISRDKGGGAARISRDKGGL